MSTPNIIPTILENIVGVSSAIRNLKQLIVKVAESDAKVLIEGETGSGKELVAKAIHALSPRKAYPYILVNCAGIPETLLESELFGHVRGAFTDAVRDNLGRVVIAHQGDLYLDEIGEMSLRMQAVLLRFLETGEIQRVGASTPTARVDVRIITATNKDLAKAVSDGLFRQDLYYRIMVANVHVPPLRYHKSDIPSLIAKINRRYAQSGHYKNLHFDDEAMQVMLNYPWPGNIRQLQNVLERLLVSSDMHSVSYRDLPDEIKPNHLVPSAPIDLNAPLPNSPSRADVIYQRIKQGQSFWTAVEEPFRARDLTRDDVRVIIRRGLEETKGSYKDLVAHFNMPPKSYKTFMYFLYKYNVHIPFQQYR